MFRYRYAALFYLIYSLLSPLVVFAAVPWDEPLEGPRMVREWLLAAIPETGTANMEGIHQDHIKPLLGIDEGELATVANGPCEGDILTGDVDFDWRVARSDGVLDIDAAIQPAVNNEHSTAYLITYITSPAEREVTVSVGSDDSICVWLNGIKVHEKAILRAIAFDQDQFQITLQPGKNVLMLKVSEHTGAWAAVTRFQYASGLLFSTDKTKDGKALPAALRYIRNWLILPLPNPAGGAVRACDEDLIWEHDGIRTEEKIALKGVLEGEATGDWRWAHGSLIDLQGDNINQMVNLSLGWVGGHNHITLYAFCTVYCPDNRHTNLWIGSDDSVVAWLAGEEVWRFEGLRGLKLDQDMAPVTLRRGQNYLLLKVCEESGGWGMSVRFEDNEGLRFSTNRDYQPVSPVGKLPTTWAAIRRTD